MGIEINSLIHEIFIAAVHGTDTVLDCGESKGRSDTVQAEVYKYRGKTSIQSLKQGVCVPWLPFSPWVFPKTQLLLVILEMKW